MTLLVVDGNSILNRAFYGIRPLVTKDGQFTNGIYGFMTMLEKIKSDTNPDAIAIAFDLKAPTFRHKAYDKYKANRKGMPEELAQQLDPLKELLTLLGYTLITKEGFEADDIIGTLSKKCENEDGKNKCVIATGDKDSLQLVDDKINVRLATAKDAVLYDTAKVVEECQVTPDKLIEIMAIQGDPSDNIPGVKGIGIKGATELIKEFGSIDYIYENIDDIDIKPGMRKRLKDGKEDAYMSHMLATIRTDVPVDTDFNKYKVKDIKKQEAVNLLAKLEMFSIIERLGLNDISVNKSQEAPEELNIEEVIDTTKLLEEIKKAKSCVFVPEYKNKKNEVLTNILIIKGCNIFIVKDKEFIKKLFEDEKIKKTTYDSKTLYNYSLKNKIDLKNIELDLLLAAYLLNPSSSDYNLDRLYQEYGISLPQIKEEEIDKKDKEKSKEKENIKIKYNIYAGFSKLVNKIKEKIKDNKQEKLLKEIEIPLAKVLAKMENAGFGADEKGIKKYGDELGQELNFLEKSIIDLVGYEFNINSPQQLSKALFEDLKLPPKKKTKTGYSTNAEVLESLYDEHQIIPMILKYRSLAKLKSTYTDGLLKVIGKDGRIHTKFNQTETRTGRISSTEPNMQNIPVRTKLGRELRKFFTAKEGCVLVDADYSQIELRVLAHISEDENMIKAFKDNIDIHTITASQVFNMPENMVTNIMRERAKAVNFGIVYGIGSFSLSKDIGVTNKEASNYIKSYLSHYSGVDNYMKNIVEKAREKGYVETMFGRRRYLPELTASNFNTRAFGERVALNMPIQGTAADIIKIAMIKVNNRLEKENMEARLILQVHDELIVESLQDESIRVAMILQEEMENAVKLNVPLVAEASVGKTWYDTRG